MSTEATEAIAEFLTTMRERHEGEIEAIELPEGTEAYVREHMGAGDDQTLQFMLKLSYLMGLHTGFAAQQEGSATRPASGPLEA